jgi:hypothetical protein
VVPAASADDGPPSGLVEPCFAGDGWNAKPGEPIHFICGWGAQGGPGKLVSYLTSHRGTLIVRNEATGGVVLRIDPDELATLWGQPTVFPADDDWVVCAGPEWRLVLWHYWLNAGLPTGVYEVTFREDLTHPVNDGNHTCWWREDGSRLAPAPSLYRGFVTTVGTLTVTP